MVQVVMWVGSQAKHPSSYSKQLRGPVELTSHNLWSLAVTRVRQRAVETPPHAKSFVLSTWALGVAEVQQTSSLKHRVLKSRIEKHPEFIQDDVPPPSGLRKPWSQLPCTWII